MGEKKKKLSVVGPTQKDLGRTRGGCPTPPTGCRTRSLNGGEKNSRRKRGPPKGGVGGGGVLLTSPSPTGFPRQGPVGKAAGECQYVSVKNLLNERQISREFRQKKRKKGWGKQQSHGHGASPGIRLPSRKEAESGDWALKKRK